MNEVVIAGAARTPMGGFQGEFDGVNASILGGVALKAALEDAQIASVDELYFGNVLPAGQGQAPARQAGFAAGLGEDVPATTLNKMCGSGMKATMIGYDQLVLGHSNVVAVGGMESMSNAPYLLPKMRGGARIGHGQVMDHMFLDGLEDAYDKGRLMGTFAEDCAEKYQFTREAQDEYALGSLSNALDAQKSGAFAREIAAVTLKTRKGEVVIREDEQPKNARPEKIPHLKPAFREGGTVTPANSSSISDGAAALILTTRSHAEANGLPWLKIKNLGIDHIQPGTGVIDDGQQSETRQPGGVGLPFEPGQFIRHPRRRDKIFDHVVKAATMHLPCLAMRLFR